MSADFKWLYRMEKRVVVNFNTQDEETDSKKANVDLAKQGRHFVNKFQQ